MMKRRVKIGSAVVLTLALVFSALPMLGADAAYPVETGRSCSVEITVADNTADVDKELDKIDIPVKLYKVASISESGTYTAAEGFEDVDFSAVEDGNGSAAEWEERAEAAMKVVTDSGAAAVKEVKKLAGQSSVMVNGLETGMYLVVAGEAQSDNYTYTFKPYMISLPNNYYYTNPSHDDTWVYNLTGTNAIGLKPEQTPRLGDLKIQKTLENINVTMGEKATFVFEVNYTTPKGATKTEIVTITFDGADTKTATVSAIPAGSVVTVTEVYSGASYTGTATTDTTTTIIADNAVNVAFLNAHDNRPNGGYGVVNNYTPDENGQYKWNKKADDADKEQ